MKTLNLFDLAFIAGTVAAAGGDVISTGDVTIEGRNINGADNVGLTFDVITTSIATVTNLGTAGGTIATSGYAAYGSEDSSVYPITGPYLRMMTEQSNLPISIGTFPSWNSGSFAPWIIGIVGIIDAGFAGGGTPSTDGARSIFQMANSGYPLNMASGNNLTNPQTGLTRPVSIGTISHIYFGHDGTDFFLEVDGSFTSVTHDSAFLNPSVSQSFGGVGTRLKIIAATRNTFANQANVRAYIEQEAFN